MRNNGKIKGLAVLGFALLAFSLAGCREDTEKVELVEKAQEEQVIRLYSGGRQVSTSNLAKYWSENFAEQTGINAVIYYDAGSTYYEGDGQDTRTILQNQLASGRADDLYIVSAEDMIDFANKGYLLDMTGFSFVDNLSEPARQLSTIDGKVYCLPLSYTGFGLYWNLDLLEEYGLAVPENYGELIEVWDALLSHGITPFRGNKGYGLTVPAMCAGFSEVYQSDKKDQLIRELADGTTPVSTYARKGFEFIKLMCDKGYMNPEQTLNTVPASEDEVAAFKNKEAACVCAIMSTKVYCDPRETGFNVKMTGWPVLEDGYISVVGTDEKLCVNPASQNLDIASSFIEMAGSKDALMKCTEDGKVSSGRKNDPSKYRDTEAEFDELIQSEGQIPNSDMNLKLNLWEDIRDISRLILSGEATVDDACRMLDVKQAQTVAEHAAAERN